MIITKIEEFNKNKIKVFIDEQYEFWLYQKDLKDYPLNQNDIVSQDTYQKLYDLNLKRGKKKALNILKRVDKTEYELKEKLEQSEFNEKIINTIIDYINSYHYIDDTRYAANFIRFKQNSKSKKEIEYILLKKGVAKTIIEQALIKEYDGEEAAIKKAIDKKKKGSKVLSFEEKQKITSYLFRKGYNLDLIKKYIELEEDF